MAPDFDAARRLGRKTEYLVARYWMDRGWSVMLACDLEQGTGFGPRVWTRDEEADFRSIVVPDLLMWTPHSVRWAEVKAKTVFSWDKGRNESHTRQWVTGIDLCCYEDYMAVEEITAIPVWLNFLHYSDDPTRKNLDNGSPETCPTGLFARALAELVHCEHHRAPSRNPDRDESLGHGRSGMVYWGIDELPLYASLDEITKRAAVTA